MSAGWAWAISGGAVLATIALLCWIGQRVEPACEPGPADEDDPLEAEMEALVPRRYWED